jgi:hypothetical protein
MQSDGLAVTVPRRRPSAIDAQVLWRAPQRAGNARQRNPSVFAILQSVLNSMQIEPVRLQCENSQQVGGSVSQRQRASPRDERKRVRVR